MKESWKFGNLNRRPFGKAQRTWLKIWVRERPARLSLCHILDLRVRNRPRLDTRSGLMGVVRGDISQGHCSLTSRLQAVSLLSVDRQAKRDNIGTPRCYISNTKHSVFLRYQDTEK